MDSNSIIDAHQNLPEWVSNFDKRFLSKLDLKEKGHQYFNDTYKACFNIRSDFRNNFLPKLESDLGFPSSPAYYKYEYFFRSHDFPEFELSNKYYYDNNINLLKKNYSSTNIKNKQMNFDNFENINKKANDKKVNININNNKNYQSSYKNTKENKKEEEKVNIVNKPVSQSINKNKNINIKNNDGNYLKSKNVNSNINTSNENKKNNNIINKNNNNNQSYKKNEINNQIQKYEIKLKINNTNNENKKEYNINKNSIVNKNENNKKNNIENKNEKSNKNQNIYTKKIEKETKVEKKNKQNTTDKINKIYNKNIIPIKEELNENEDEIQNISKSSKKISSKSNQNMAYPQSPTIIKSKESYNSLNSTNAQKGKIISNKNIIYTKAPINRIETKQKTSNENNSSKNPEILKSSTKRGSIKNYLLLRNSNILEDNDKLNTEPKLKVADNMNHSRIKNYLRNKNNEENEKTEELSINIKKGNSRNDIQMNKKIMRESKSSYDVFKKTPLKK